MLNKILSKIKAKILISLILGLKTLVINTTEQNSFSQTFHFPFCSSLSMLFNTRKQLWQYKVSRQTLLQIKNYKYLQINGNFGQSILIFRQLQVRTTNQLNSIGSNPFLQTPILHDISFSVQQQLKQNINKKTVWLK